MIKLNRKNQYSPLLILLAFSGLFLFVGLGHARLIDWDENIYAEASRQMIERGDYLNIAINNHPFAEKPPFFFWEQTLSYRIFGVNEFAARFPSAFAGMMMALLCFYVGKRINSARVGLLWGLIYLTCLLPSSFARAGVIDFTFNLFIAGGAFFLYLFDYEFGRFLEEENKRPSAGLFSRHIGYLTLAGVSMGLAVLTKGPLGGVIPLISFAGYKWFYRQPRIRAAHFAYCAVLSLTIALSWYVANGVAHGSAFIEGFWRFQKALFSRTLEGHSGPFYYHFVVALAGLAPWTAFLLMFRPRQFWGANRHCRPLFILGVSWTIFVLVLMSFVSTKLPHYSASVYIPLSFVIAMVLDRQMDTEKRFPIGILALYLISTAGMGLLMLMIPDFSARYLSERGISFEISWSPFIPYAAVVLICLGLAGAAAFGLRKLKSAVIITALFMFIFTQSIWRFFVPPLLSYIQEPLIDMVNAARQRGGKVVFYRMVSFAALFYGKQPIEMLHTYKFPGNPEILDVRHDRDLYVFADIKDKDRLKREHPLVEHVEDRGIFSLHILRKK